MNKDFISLLSGRFQPKPSESAGTLTDIHDGSVYLQHMHSDGFLRNPNNISLTMNTDGVQVFKSSGASLWPVYFLVNELPPQLRYRVHIIILVPIRLNAPCNF